MEILFAWAQPLVAEAAELVAAAQGERRSREDERHAGAELHRERAMEQRAAQPAVAAAQPTQARHQPSAPLQVHLRHALTMLASVPTGGDAARLVDEVVPLQSEEIVIPAAGVRSLRWDGETLVDDADGGARFDLDGTVHGRRFGVSFRFDRAVVSPTGRFTVLLERYGTKAVLFDQGRVLRELDRSFYFANVYEYP